MVRSILEYSTVIWNQYYNVVSDTVEKVQRKIVLYLL